ncbi:MAG: DUF1987 domain-containing protein [Methylotenera sp.]|nr:DUF1987 domain-containing protein [Methylotenera sp.]
MKDLYVSRTSDSPEVDFKYSINQLNISGEAFPEDANSFFYPLLVGLEEYLKVTDNQDVEFNFCLTYFNSASTKMLFSIFELLNDSASSSNRVVLNWHYDEDDDTIKEFGQDVYEDFPSIDYNPVVTYLA